jgi:hypothetical protein
LAPAAVDATGTQLRGEATRSLKGATSCRRFIAGVITHWQKAQRINLQP